MSKNDQLIKAEKQAALDARIATKRAERKAELARKKAEAGTETKTIEIQVERDIHMEASVTLTVPVNFTETDVQSWFNDFDDANELDWDTLDDDLRSYGCGRRSRFGRVRELCAFLRKRQDRVRGSRVVPQYTSRLGPKRTRPLSPEGQARSHPKQQTRKSWQNEIGNRPTTTPSLSHRPRTCCQT